MKDYQATREPIWPYIGVVSCLFVLSVVAARSWKPPTALRDPAKAQQQTRATAARLGADSLIQPSGEFATRSFVPPVLRNRDLSSPKPRSAWDQLAEAHALPAQEVGPSENTPVLNEPAVDVREVAVADSAAPVETSPSDLIETLVLPSQRVNLAPPVAEKVEIVPRVAAKPEVSKVPEQVQPVRETPQPVVKEPIKVATRPVRQQPPTAVVPKTSVRKPEVAATPKNRSSLDFLVDALNQDRNSLELANELDLVLREFEHSDAPSSALLARIGGLSDRAKELAMSADRESRSTLLRASYALQRRQAIWKQINDIQSNTRFISVGLHDIEDSVRAVDEKLGNSSVANGWRNYLQLSDLLSTNASGDGVQQRVLARRVLERMRSEELLTEQQRKYLAQAPFSELVAGLERWAREPINYDRLSQVIERYESRRGAAEASELARMVGITRWDGRMQVAKLAKLLNVHYRNANLRVATSAELINRLLPQPEVAEEEIDEFILGACVKGTSRTKSKLRVVLVPDDRLWRMRLEAEGSVESSTSASKGPATFYNDGVSEFNATKTLVVNGDGVKVELADADADSASELTGFQTQYDSVPVVGLLARAIARQQHDDRYFDAQAATEYRLEEKARERLDQEVHLRLEEMERDFEDKILQPFNALKLRPQPLDMHTTDQRLVVRYRLAGSHQLGAHTPRPQAPSDSLLSVQLHETVLNNVVEQLNLDGSREDLRGMYRRIAAQFGQPDLEVPEDIPEGITIQFADREAVRFQFENDRVALNVRIAELSNGRRSWRNFQVRAHYAPDPTQLEANLVRDSYIELPNSRLRLGDQIALRGVFSKVFSKSRPISVVNKRLARHPRMSDLQVTQFTVKDGWIGVALGPQRVEIPQVAEGEQRPRR